MVFSTTSAGRRPSAAEPEPSRAGMRAVPPVGGRAGPRRAGAAAVLSELARREAPRRLLWLPVALGVGIGIYFALPFEPAPSLGPGIAAAAIATAVLVRRQGFALWLLLLAVAAGVGFSAAALRTRTVATSMLQREVWADLEGRVRDLERRPSDWRITLDAIALSGANVGPAVPSGVRVTAAGRALGEQCAALRIGDRIRLRARLRPPSAPVAPGAFDFQRSAFYRGIGAVGFVAGPLTVVAPAPPGLANGWQEAVDRLRAGLAGRIRDVLPGPTGAVAAAMLVGDRAGIDEPTAEAFRRTGLAHLLAISGLHMALVAGTVFVVVRLLLAACPAVALRRPVKKWAAALSLLAAAIYLLLAGAPVPTQRAFLMTGLVLGGVLLDREAVSLHLVAWAAATVLLVAPESLTGPSFQLSFAAVTGLVAVWEALVRRRDAGSARRPGPVRRAFGYVGRVAATSVVASVVTAPIVAHHFQQVPVLGAAANLVAVPLTAFVTMPAGVATLLGMPFGLEVWPLHVMGWGIEATLRVAALAADGPLTAAGVPALGTAPLVLLAFGGIWLAIWRTWIRWLGLPILAVGVLVGASTAIPDALISPEGELTAVRTPGEGWLVSTEHGAGFVRDAWQRRWGGARAAGFLAIDAAERTVGFRCDGLGCVLTARGRVLAMPASPEAALEDCARADVVVTAVRLRRGCPPGVVVIDRDDLRRNGAHAIWLSPDGVRVLSVAAVRGRRPWVVGSPGVSAPTGKSRSNVE